MYYITKIFTYPMGHRLSKLEGISKCCKIHGHSFGVEITVKSEKLNEYDMVMDFSKLKELINKLLENWDHGMCINKNDKTIDPKFCFINYFDGDPTAENLCKWLYNKFNDENLLPEPVKIHSVAIWEAPDSKAKYEV
jgi:6-pyruvoyltetrahydropterin/6-carboxytetrahydropterin synthase